MPKKSPDKPFKNACKVVPPFIRPATDMIADRLGKTTFGVDPFFMVKGQNDVQDDVVAAYLQRGLQWYMERMRMPARMDRGNSLIARDGLSWAVVRYVHNTTWVKNSVRREVEQQVLGENGQPMLNALSGQPYTTLAERQEDSWERVTTYKGPEVRIESAEDCGVYPAAATTTDDVEGYYRKVTRTLREWRELESAGMYENIDDLERNVEVRNDQDEQTRKEGVEPSLPGKDPAAPKTAYECIWRWRSKQGPDAWYVFTISLEPRALLRAEEYWYNHGRPNIIPLRILPRQNSLYGYSIPELCENLQEEMNALLRQHTDAGTASNQITTVGPRLTGMEEVVHQIGRHNQVDDPASTQVVNMPGPDGSLTTVFAMLDTLGQRLTGAGDLSYGAIPKQEVKATEGNAARAEADIKFNQHLARYQFGSGALLYGVGLNEVALQVLGVMHQYCGDQLERVLGADPFVVVPLRDLISEYDISAKAVTPRSNMDIEKQTRLAFASVLTDNPVFAQFVMAFPQRAHALLEWIAEPHDIHGLDRFIGTTQEAGQMQGAGMPQEGMIPQGEPLAVGP